MLAYVIRLRDSKNGLTNKSLRSTRARVKLEQLDKQPRSQALRSCGDEDPGRGWSRVTRISRDKFELYRGRGRKGAY